MTEPKQKDDKRSEDRRGSETSDDREASPWLVIVCVIVIIVTVALIVNELRAERSSATTRTWFSGAGRGEE